MKPKFLFYITYPYSIPICKPLEREIQGRGMVVKWFVEKENTKNYFKGEELVLNLQEAIDFSPDIVLTATDYVADFIPGIKVQLFHGFPANKRKGIDQFQIRNFFDLYCTQGPSSTKPFTEKSKRLKHFEVVETGWSKMDDLYPLAPLTQAKDENKNKKPVILVSSTFTKQYSLALNDQVVTELKRLSETGKWHFDIVLHPLLSKEVVETFKALQNDHLRYHDTTDLIPLFKESDVMLCDTSSALVEYLLQLKPVVTFKNNMPLPSYIDITEVSELENALTLALSRPTDLIQEIEKYAQEIHPYQDGKSSERVIDTVLDFLEKDKSHMKPKPLNLLRKYKVRKKLGYFTLKSY